jgi:PAS domain-containing protein
VHKFPITEYKRFSELPLDKFNTLKFSVYILDFEWNYLFVNEFAKSILGKRGEELVGKNMWEVFDELRHDPSFKEMRIKMEKKVTTNIIVVSPIHGQRQNITGYALEDCLYFSSSILPDKENLIEELRQQLLRKKIK